MCKYAIFSIFIKATLYLVYSICIFVFVLITERCNGYTGIMFTEGILSIAFCGLGLPILYVGCTYVGT